VAPAPGTIATSATPSLVTPVVRVLGSTATSAELAVKGATRPFWLVLGESQNAGWEATGPGGRSLGAPQLIDGYANGWFVTPPRSGTFVVTLQFGPQRVVTPAILASGATLVLCLLLGLVPVGRLRRRLVRRRSHGAERRTAKPANGAAAAAEGTPQHRPSGIARKEPLDAAPLLGPPFQASGRAPHLPCCVLVAALCGAVAMVVLPPPWAPSIAGATAVASFAGLRWGRARSILGLAAAGCIGAAGAVTVLDQLRHHYSPGSSWPHNFETAGVLAFVAVVALAADSIVGLARRHSRVESARNGPQDK
jgi:hypothetical protein